MEISHKGMRVNLLKHSSHLRDPIRRKWKSKNVLNVLEQLYLKKKNPSFTSDGRNSRTKS